ncbi:BHRF1 [Macacine gammaherpesvirus 4]|uniref:BHRF1 n=1 Tax=Macacine gammaherpesvirus 4 TaxID=45455 RepID=Q8UZJ4_9GAMA|nr:BHRF1 [Macacine gammaherpesvirus 4]AAK95415.1 BHRF1 [Macacine gammaherpesvirus 4]
MAFSTRDLLLALCMRDSHVHGNEGLHPVLELASRESPSSLSAGDTLVLRVHVLLEQIIEQNAGAFLEALDRFLSNTEEWDVDFTRVFQEIFHRGNPTLGRALAWLAWCMHACRTLCCNRNTPYYVVDLSVRGMLEASEGLDAWIHQQGGWPSLLRGNRSNTGSPILTAFLAGLTLTFVVVCSYLFISGRRR